MPSLLEFDTVPVSDAVVVVVVGVGVGVGVAVGDVGVDELLSLDPHPATPSATTTTPTNERGHVLRTMVLSLKRMTWTSILRRPVQGQPETGAAAAPGTIDYNRPVPHVNNRPGWRNWQTHGT